MLLAPSVQKKTALSRLIKDNVALIMVLEAKFGNQGVDNPVKRQQTLMCMFHNELKDIKLWQVHTLLKGLEKIAASADIPMLVCGDFNSDHKVFITSNVKPLDASFKDGSMQFKVSLANGTTPLYPSSVAQRNGGEAWVEVGRLKTYTPTTDDIGHPLKFECVVLDAETNLSIGLANTILTSHVIPAPCPTPRRLISVREGDVSAIPDLGGRISSSGTFTVLSYNILSDSYATSELYSYCPSWALSWT
ncbi:unnamed protein product [Cuscuta campestris]|uniref:Endonuclease/exonuclease/phosphatase domain-containing protein n=1 Tax=Cuscuta campestris TaxID=132261 RepID=A0A484L791_9ASTE|nr:unnamed protein product [Cuscuta campestris]